MHAVLELIPKMISLYTLSSANWQIQFDEDFTAPRDFKLAPGKKKAVPMMKDEIPSKFGRSPNLKCSAIEIPYKGKDLSMVVILPDEDFGLQVHLLGASIDLETCQSTYREKKISM